LYVQTENVYGASGYVSILIFVYCLYSTLWLYLNHLLLISTFL